MPIENLPIFCYYDKQQFTQFGPMDCANWYGVSASSAKKKQGLYPCMGRRHVTLFNENKLIFDAEPRKVFKTINFFYVVDGTRVFQYDRFYNRKFIGSVALGTSLWFDFLVVGTTVYGMLTDEVNIYVITETGTTVTMAPVTDPNAPGGATTGGKPGFVASFGNRFLVSIKDSPDYYLTRINLLASSPDTGTLANCFTINGSPLFNRASGIVKQLAVLHNQLYILCNFVTDIWANVITQITVAGVTREFPWKLISSYNWDYGIADPNTLSVGFGRIAFLAQNNDGLVSFMVSIGQQPEDISTQAINVLLENSQGEPGSISPFIANTAYGFLYQYNNTIFYRVSAGLYEDLGQLDVDTDSNCIEYNFDTKTWHRAIELNGQRNRIQQHIYFNNVHLVTVEGDPAMYEMAGNIFRNELRNTSQTDPQAADAFNKYPMRYELTTEQIFLEGYAEFKDDYVEIDFMFGDKTFYESQAPFLNTQYIVTEESTLQSPVYVVTEDGDFVIVDGTNTPTFDDNHYYALFKPHLELYYSDDGGVTFTSSDLRPFSQLGQYRWRMRWYELGTSRNRCYRLVCVSSAPIVILGAVRNTMRISGGAN